jgi:hypothetical protein
MIIPMLSLLNHINTTLPKDFEKKQVALSILKIIIVN